MRGERQAMRHMRSSAALSPAFYSRIWTDTVKHPRGHMAAGREQCEVLQECVRGRQRACKFQKGSLSKRT